MKHIPIVTAAVAALTISAMAPDTARAQSGALDDGKPVGGAIAGGIARGTFKLVGEAVTEMIRREYPGSSIIYKTGSALGSLAQLMEGEADLALGFSAVELSAALSGEPPFKKAYSTDRFRVVARIADNMQLFAIAPRAFVEENKIRTFKDIVDRKIPIRLSLHRREVMTVNGQVMALLSAYGIGPKDIESWGGAVFNEATSGYTRLMKNRRLDAAFSTTWHPSKSVVELDTSIPVTFIPFDRPQIEQIAKKFNVDTTETPASAYDFLKKGYFTTSLSFPLLARPGVSDALTYKIAKALYNNFDYYKTVHPVFKRYSKDMLSKAGAYTLHPGAKAFYTQAGVAR